MITKYKTLLLFFAAVLFSITTAFSQGGTTGPLTWSYNVTDSTLTITGNGAMPDYNYPNNVPWCTDKKRVNVYGDKTPFPIIFSLLRCNFQDSVFHSF